MFICFSKEPHNSCYLCSTFCAAFSAMATDSTDTELTIIGEYTLVHVPQLLRAAALLTMGNIITVR